jgi:predicted ATPase
MRFLLLGPLEVWEGERLVRIGSRRQRALLVALLLRRNEVVPAERLMEAVWGEAAPVTGVKALQVLVAQLRKTVGSPVVETRAPGYRVAAGPDELDITRFERLVGDGRTGSELARRESLVEALGLFRGEPLADFRYEAFARSEIARLEELRLVALEERIELDLELGRSAELVPELETLIAEHPLRERSRGLLMLALYRCGRQAEALEVYRLTRRLLVDELGIEPGEELQRLEREILLRADSLAPPHREAVSVTPAGRLPVPLTPLVGRRRELGEAGALLARSEVRLVVLTGAGGSGKTRLALQVASEAGSRYRDGIVFVGLAGVRDPGDLGTAILQQLDVRAVSAKPVEETLVGYFEAKQTLLVLDNFEQLVDGASQVSRLLASAPGLNVLVTSRAPLHLEGEHEYLVGPLRLPSAEPLSVADALGSEAVELFRERAQALAPAFTIDAHNVGAVVDICERLDGLPLAIELAAARINLLGPEEIAGRLDDRLSFLTTGVRDAPERHRTLRATLAWSYELLTPDQQRLFRRLSVFEGGFTLTAAEAVCGDERGSVLDGLASLVDHSLLTRDQRDPRLRMLETVREYAREQLEHRDDADRGRRRHADHMLALALASDPYRTGGPHRPELLIGEEDNLHAAYRFFRAHDRAAASELTSAAFDYLTICGPYTLLGEWMEAVVAEPDTDPRIKAEALAALGYLARTRGDTTRATAFASEALSLARPEGHLLAVAWALYDLAFAALGAGDHRLAQTLGDEALVAARTLGNPMALMETLGVRGSLETDLDDARGYFQEAIEVAQAVGDPAAIAGGDFLLASLAFRQREYTEAAALLRAGLRATPPNDLVFIYEYVLDLAATLARQGVPRRSARLLGAAETLRKRLAVEPEGIVMMPKALTANETLAELRTAMNPSDLEHALEQGRELSVEAAIQEALTEPP